MSTGTGAAALAAVLWHLLLGLLLLLLNGIQVLLERAGLQGVAAGEWAA